MTYGRWMQAIPRRILEIVLDQRSVTDHTIALQVSDQCTASEVAAHTGRLEQQGLIAQSDFAAGRWHVTDAGRSALEQAD